MPRQTVNTLVKPDNNGHAIGTIVKSTPERSSLGVSQDDITAGWRTRNNNQPTVVRRKQATNSRRFIGA